MKRTVVPGIWLMFAFTFLLSGFSAAQVTISPGSGISLTPLQFVENYLVGTGVTVSNATYNGSANPLNVLRPPSNTKDQIGNFTASGAASVSLGLAGGIMLSSGKVQDASVAVFSGVTASYASGSGGDPDLNLLAGVATKDKSVLEFDFVPLTDVISFRYVFASEEFDEYCDQFNDVFGFFIHGPGIPAGPYSGGAQNIAFLPETIMTVTIFNICSSDSGLMNGMYSWWNGEGPIYTYDRFTSVLTASIGVICSQTYHLKIAVGDAVDGQFDSGIFLEANSLTSNNFTGSTSFSNPQTGEYLVEGCSNAELVYMIPEPRTTDLTINLNISTSGTATQADILPNPFPSSIVIPGGMVQSIPIPIIAVADGLSETTESLVIDASTTICGFTNTVTQDFLIKDYIPLSVLLDDQTVCEGAPVALNAVVTGGQPALPANVFSYLWSTGATTSGVTVSPSPGINTYAVTVTDACSQEVVKHVVVNVVTQPDPAGMITGSATTICTPMQGVTFTVPTITGAENYIWTVPVGAAIVAGNNTSSITVDFSTAAYSSDISVRGHSSLCGDGMASSLALIIHPLPEPAAVPNGSNILCQGDPATTYYEETLDFTADYEWSVPSGVTIISGAGTNLITCLFTPMAVSGNITVRGHNTPCGYGPSASLPVIVNQLPGDPGQISGETSICTPSTGQTYHISAIPGADNYTWTLPAGATLISGNNSNTITVDFSSTAAAGNISVFGQSVNCGDGPASSILIGIDPSPGEAGDIHGPDPVCQGTTPVTYYIDPVDFASDYEWLVPAGVNIISGSGTSQITCVFTASSASGSFTVRGHNSSCGFGAPATKNITVNPTPGDAGQVTGSATICTPVSGEFYTVDPVAGAESYQWTLPAGAAIVMGAGTTTIGVDFSVAAASGDIRVRGHSAFCGDGQEATLPVDINPSPEPAGTIHGDGTACQGPIPFNYAVDPISYATSYDWQVPTGVTILSGGGTSSISCLFPPSAVSGSFSVRGHNVACGYGAPSVLPVTINPLPGDAGAVTSANGSVVCQGQTGATYGIMPIPNTSEYLWSYTGSGVTLINPGPSLVIDFSNAATSGSLIVTGHNGCGNGAASPPYQVTVKEKPTVTYSICNTIKTTKNGRPILLKGGTPPGGGGIYSGTAVASFSPEGYAFDPSSGSVTGGTGPSGVDYPVKYSYTNAAGCSDEKTTMISVYQSNASDPCPGTLTDHRDGRIYQTIMTGSGSNARCWMAENLDYGAFTDQAIIQTDNCAVEKYCLNNNVSQCGIYGGGYQWDEIMEHHENTAFQDICPGGWHIATSNEWDQLITENQGVGMAGAVFRDLLTPYGFHGLTGGLYYLNHHWAYASGVTLATMFWTSNGLPDGRAIARGLNSINPGVSYYPSSRANAFSVRCVRN